MRISKTTTVKSFYVKDGRGEYADKYLIMYDELSRFFDVYKLNINVLSLVPRLELYTTLEVPLEKYLNSDNNKINKEMIMEVLEEHFNN